MREPTTSRRSPARPENPAGVAVFLINATGRITHANTGARHGWPELADDFCGRAFVKLFAFEIVSSDPDFEEAQWEVLLATALDGSATLKSDHGAASTANSTTHTVSLEKIPGPTLGYMAVVQPPASPPAAPPAAPAPGLPVSLTVPARPPSAGDEASGLRLLIAESDGGFFDLNFREGRGQFSATWKKMLGYEPSDLPDTLEAWHDLIHPDDSSAAPDQLSRKRLADIESGGLGTHRTRPFNVEFRMKHQEGHWVWVQSFGVQSLDAAGELDRVIGVHLEISERKELEEALVVNDTRLHELSHAGPLAAFELDFTNGIFWFSSAWIKLFGFSESDFAPTLDAFAATLPLAAETAGVTAWLSQRAPGQSSFSETGYFHANDGRTIPVVFGAHRTFNRKRELQRVVGFACAAPLPTAPTAPSEPHLPTALTQAAFDTLAEAVLITAPDHTIIFGNATARRLLQLGTTALEGQAVDEVFRLVNRQTFQPPVSPVTRALAAETRLPLITDDALIPVAEGTALLPIAWTAQAAFAEDRRPHGVIIVFRDPTEMTLTPEELLSANRFEALSILAGRIAHDFNNLLTPILGAIALAKDQQDDSALANAEKACLNAKDLAQQLLTFASGGTHRASVCASRALLADAITIAAAGSSAEIALEVAEDVAPVSVDRAQILHVFQNLILNALQAMPPTPHRPRLQLRAANITLGLNQVPALTAGDYVEFEVRDNGSGIDPAHVGKIFDPFFSTKKHRTGLGLATALSIVRTHAGQIGLDTQVGVGTAFTVFLPSSRPAVAPAPARPAISRFLTGRILLMDDDPKISMLTARMLQTLGYTYDLAPNGEQAIELYRHAIALTKPYDAVIMDLTVIGGMGGEECFGELQKMDPDVRAIVATGYDNADTRQRFLEKGFRGFLAKPYRVPELGKALKDILN